MCKTLRGFPGGSEVKNLPLKQETWVQPLGQADHLEKGMQPTPEFLPGKSRGQRRLAGCRPWGSQKTWQRNNDKTLREAEEVFPYVRL